MAPTYDVVVVGAGVAGCCTARELARYDLRVLVLEAGNDIANGATRANSGIVHAGFDPRPGTCKAHYNVAGVHAMPHWAADLGFAYYKNGAYVLAFTDEEVERLYDLQQRAVENGAPEVFIVSAEEVRAAEPDVSPEVKAALWAPDSGVVDPYGLAYASLENALTNGVELAFSQQVCDVQREEGGFILTTQSGEEFHARAVVNAAGINSDVINNYVSSNTFSITARRGDYILFDVDATPHFTHTMFQAPTANGKGVLVARTVHGNPFIGPDAVAQDSRDSFSTTADSLSGIVEAAKKTWPGLSLRGQITNFAGLRSTGSVGDFVIGQAPDVPGFFNIACFDSPGLTSAPAVAEAIASEVGAYLGADKRETFNPKREAPFLFAMATDEQRAAVVRENPAYGHIVCRCCNVSEGELVDALRSPIPALALDALKWRTGATMGRCHGGFCSPEIMRIMARELHCAPEDIDKRLAGSRFIASARSDYAALAGNSSSTPADVAGDSYDVVVVGGGAAGMAAAVSARRAGAARVLLIDREATLGGVMKQCIHDGFGLHRFGKELTGPEFSLREAIDVQSHGVEVMQSATVLRIDAAGADGGVSVAGLADNGINAGNSSVGISADANSPHQVVVVSPAGQQAINATAVVLATGSRERGAGALNLAGSRPAGVFSAGSAQALMNLQGCLPGKRAVILGSGDIGLIMARRMTLSGMEVEGVFELRDYPSGLKRNIVQCLDDFGIPLTLSATVVRLEGKRRLEAVWVADVDPATRKPIPSTERRIECDTLLLSVGLIPENELAKAAGVAMDAVTGGAQVNDALATSVPGVFACGNALHVHDLADYAAQEGEIAGANAARFAYAKTHATPPNLSSAVAGTIPGSIEVQAGDNVRYVVPQCIRGIEQDSALRSVSVFFRVSSVLERPRFIAEAIDAQGNAHELAVRSAMVAVPAEMRQLKIDRSGAADCKCIRIRVEEGA